MKGHWVVPGAGKDMAHLWFCCAGWAQEQPLERRSEGPGRGDPGQDALTSPPPCADLNTANNWSDVWLATAAQGVSFHIRHLFSFHKKPTGNSVAVSQMGRVVWKGLFGLLGSAVGSNGIRGQQLWEGWPRASGLELLEALVFSCFSPDFSWPSDTCFLVQEHHPCS